MKPTLIFCEIQKKTASNVSTHLFAAIRLDRWEDGSDYFMKKGEEVGAILMGIIWKGKAQKVFKLFLLQD